MTAPPKFRREDRPPWIINASGMWLASELGPDFKWVESGRALKVTIAPGRTAEVRLRPSHWNRSGVLTHVEVQVAIRDRTLANWRRAQGRKSSGLVADTSVDVVWSYPMINIDNELDSVELFGDVARATGSKVPYLKLPDLLVAIRARILPKLLMFESPARAARELPDIWLAQPVPMIEWATCLGDEESARLIRTRSDRLKGVAPPESELEITLAAGRELLEILRAELRHFREHRELDIANELVHVGLELTHGMIRELSDPQGRTDRVPEGALRDWAAHNLPPASPIRAKAIAFDAAASRLRRSG
ncbi:MAG TPA: hypothetical protein VGV88_06060 [Candidatus Dormibacteraeota bacterium]|nr:hypothetical protein [Candidatus Dormibacteraeota bacterium]